MIRRLVLLTVAAVALSSPTFARAGGGEAPLRRIAFGSCARQDRPQPIWESVVAARPDLFLFLGDTIYGDSTDMAVLRKKYAQLAAMPGWQKLRNTCPVLATWDDHDYGANDAGAEYPKKDESQQVFLDFFGVPKGSPRRTQKGVYHAAVFGPPGRRVQVILLDTRYFRSPLKKRGLGRYVANEDRDATILGAAQWKWLGEQLKVPAQLRLLVSSIQVVADDHAYEKWMNFPRERERLYQLLRDTKAAGVVVLSGDRHLAELSVMDAGLGYPLYDLTSSGINQGYRGWRKLEVNRHRVATMNQGDNFGLITIDWDRPSPLIGLQIRDEQGDLTIQQKVPLSWLRPGVIKRAAGGRARLLSGELLTPAVVAKHLHKKCTVELEVRSTGAARELVFLNSAADRASEDNVTVVIPKAAEAAFRKAGVADVRRHYEGKTVRVTAELSEFRARPQLVLSGPEQIEVVTKKSGTQ